MQWVVRFDVLALGAVPLHVLIALALYIGSLAVIGGCPRGWNDRQRFAEYVAQWRSHGGTLYDPTTTEEELRAISWFDGSIAIAQQSGFVAGAAAAFGLLSLGYTTAIIAFGLTTCAVGLIVRSRLLAAQRHELEPLLKKLESEDDGR